MDYNYDDEIRILNKSENITDKIKIFSIYCDFYVEMTSLLVFQNNLIVPEYKKYLTQVFKSTVEKMESMERNANYLDFFNSFLGTLLDDELMREVPNRYLSLTLETYISKLKPTDNFVNKIPYVDVLDTIDMDFATKARVLLIIKEYFKDFDYNISVLYYRKEDALSYIKGEIVNKIVSSIPEIVSRSTGFDSFKDNLQEYTYDTIKAKIDVESTTFNNFSNRSLNEYYSELKDDKKEIFWSIMFIWLSGCDKDNCVNNKSIFEEINYNLKVSSINNLLKRMLLRDLRRR